MKQKSKGFTLIEVLIAAVILFSALAITAELYSSSSLSAEKAMKNSRVSQAASVAIHSIKADLRKKAENRKLKEHKGNVAVMGIEFQWVAKREAFTARAEEVSDVEPPRKQFSLFYVDVTPIIANRNHSNFGFKVTTW